MIAQIFARPLLHDNVRLFLLHFQENTNDNELKKANEKVETFYTSDTLNHSLIVYHIM